MLFNAQHSREAFIQRAQAITRKALLCALTLLGGTLGFSVLSAAQESPVVITLESYLVTEVTKEDGTVEEEFSEAATARPGELLEYRLHVVNTSDEALPGGRLAVTGPIPEGTHYFADSATPSAEAFRAEFSADGGETFFEEPVLITVVDEDGEEQEVVAEPSEYNFVRWVVLTDLEPEEELLFSYRVAVQ